MVLCSDTLCGMDTDEVFGYTTQKVVWIRDRWIGGLYYFMIGLVLLEILGDQILWRNEHFMLKDVQGMPRLWLSHPTVGNCDPGAAGCKSAYKTLGELAYCDVSPLNYSGKAHCEYKDRISLQDSGSRVQSVFIPTAVETVTEHKSCFPSAENGYSCDNVYEPLPGKDCLHGDSLCKTRGTLENQFYYVADIYDFLVRFTSSYERGDIRGTSLMHPGYMGVCKRLLPLANVSQTWTDRKENAKYKCTEEELTMVRLECLHGADCSAVREFDHLEDKGVSTAGKNLQKALKKQIDGHMKITGMDGMDSVDALALAQGGVHARESAHTAGRQGSPEYIEPSSEDMPNLPPSDVDSISEGLDSDVEGGSNSLDSGVDAGLAGEEPGRPLFGPEPPPQHPQRLPLAKPGLGGIDHATASSSAHPHSHRRSAAHRHGAGGEQHGGERKHLRSGHASLAAHEDGMRQPTQATNPRDAIPNMYTDNWGDVFKVSTLLELAGANLDKNYNMDGWSTRQAGTVLEVKAVYNNMHPLISSFGYRPVSYHYSVRQLTIPYVTRVKLSSTQPADYPNSRTYEIQYGLLIYFKVAGTFGFFNIVYLIVMLTAAFALTSTATSVTDIVSLYLHPRRKNFFHLKYEVSPDFSDTWECTKCGYHNLNKIGECQGHDRWISPHDVPICGHAKPTSPLDREDSVGH